MTEDRSTASVDSWQMTLALLSLAAAGIHFAVMPDHFDEALLFGLFFAVVSWAQVLWAVAILMFPNRLVLLVGLVGNLGVIAVWAMSRTVGVPIGPEVWTPEAVGAADVLSTLLEAAIGAGCAVLLLRKSDNPARAESRTVRAPAVALALGASLAVITTVTVAAAPEHEHGHDESEVAHSHDAADAGDGHAGHTAGGHGDHVLVGGSGEPDMAQIAVVEQAMRKYHDIKAARADGWEQEHADWPELGAHFVNNKDWNGGVPARPGVHVTDPEFLMYSKFLTGSWKLVAVAYVFDQAKYPEPPTGLHGATYHQHVWNCIKNGDELEEEDWGVITEDECAIMGGKWSPGGVWMTHVWLVNNPNGIFAETNPTLTNLFRT